jgi:hypothetical protein
VSATPRDSQLGHFSDDFGAKHSPKKGTIASFAQGEGEGRGVPARGTRGGGAGAGADPEEREAGPGGFNKFRKERIGIRERLNGCPNHSGPHHINRGLDFHFIDLSQTGGSVAGDRLGGKVEDPAYRTELSLAKVLGRGDELRNVRQHSDGLSVVLTSSNRSRKTSFSYVFGSLDKLLARGLPLHGASRRAQEETKVFAVSLDLYISPFRDMPREPAPDSADVVV